MITQEALKALLDYDPESGLFTNRFTRSARAVKGRIAGCLTPEGYILIGLLGQHYLAHRLAFLYITGEMPSEEVDHSNGNRADNRWCNLRQASRTENARNTPKKVSNTSGVSGVHWDARKGKWQVRVRTGIKRAFGGYFDSLTEAAAKRDQMVERYHREFGAYH